jgi:hypothetical protein
MLKRRSRSDWPDLPAAGDEGPDRSMAVIQWGAAMIAVAAAVLLAGLR